MKHVQTARISIWNCKKSWVSCSSFCSVTSSKHIYIYTFIKLILIILRPPGVAGRGETAPWAMCLSAQKSSWDTFCASADLPGKSMARRNQEKTVDFFFTKVFSGFERVFCQASRSPCKVAESWVAQDISACTELWNPHKEWGKKYT